ncbi:hypothetical protein HBI56_128520 [Parastagonospora nodorum]|nr:hypothetical protein HBH46_231590 [Parastagonospora nodorum]KAH4404851.1 hypothetical protein HBH92_188960 [Parastagonospora nodorum]KAH4423350.1 hypothetical protein HBH93_193320 [Parastagonospora nodorum]KAH4465543.1 hypothetical protein HBH91_037700 [Parastagonospora nodorum]KAH4488590.1 hypothetical protein HBH89_194390 [Parastagonospora nodorum]
MQSLEVCEARRYHRALYILVGNQTARMIQLKNNTWVLGTRRRSGLMSPGRLASLYRCTRIQRVQEKIVGHGGSNDVRAWRCFNALRRTRSCVRNMASSFCAFSRRSFAKRL